MMDMEQIADDFKNNLAAHEKTEHEGRVRAKVTRVSQEFKVTEVFLEIRKKDEEFDRGAYVTIYEDREGSKRFNVSGEHDLEVWADVMKYIKSA